MKVATMSKMWYCKRINKYYLFLFNACLIAALKIPWQKQIDHGFILAHSSRGQCIMSGKSRQQLPIMHLESESNKEWMLMFSSHPFIFFKFVQQFSWVFQILHNSLQPWPETGLLSDPRSCQDDCQSQCSG